MDEDQLHRGTRCARANGDKSLAVMQRVASSPWMKLLA